ncbi:MAG: ATP-binding cassette domain-containing protein, partial [Actinobacteria bacterium]|nr:ATP-binding cassette domain-containing protein [Actinomycetota bacterium]
QSIAFFTRTQTGALISRINSDVIGAQQAFTTTLSGLVSNVLSLILVVGTMLFLSWQITIFSLILLPVFIIPTKWVGRRLQKLTRDSFNLNAEMSATMTERFNVSGALLVSLYGDMKEEGNYFSTRARKVANIGISIAMLNRVFIDSGEILKGISFEVPAGTMTALVGPSGAGKTTISALVSRLYDVTGGEIKIGGTDVRDLQLTSLREAIGVVTQDAHMFHDSIAANLRYAKADASESEMIEACKSAQIWEMIQTLPNGFDTVVGERGHRLSGGEKQRLAIARLLLKAPRIVILDEATAHLDSENEALVQEALSTALKNRTSIVIAHRLSTVRAADQIVVLNDGIIEGKGRHDELLAQNGLYADLYQRQSFAL